MKCLSDRSLDFATKLSLMGYGIIYKWIAPGSSWYDSVTIIDTRTDKVVYEGDNVEDAYLQIKEKGGWHE